MRNCLWLIAISLLLQACNTKNPHELVVGTWKLDNIKYEREINPDIKPMVEAQIQSLRETFRLEYKADSTYHSHSIKDEHGKWFLTNNGKTMTHRDAEGEQVYEIVKLSKDELHLKTTLRKETITLQLIPDK